MSERLDEIKADAAKDYAKQARENRSLIKKGLTTQEELDSLEPGPDLVELYTWHDIIDACQEITALGMTPMEWLKMRDARRVSDILSAIVPVIAWLTELQTILTETKPHRVK